MDPYQFLLNGLIMLTTMSGRDCLESIFQKLPPEFFTDVTSKNKKHATDTLLARHSLNCALIATRLCRAYDIQPGTRHYDRIITAALVHDGWKRWEDGRWTEHTTDDHAGVAARKIQALGQLAIGDMVATHMSMWGTIKQPIHRLNPGQQIVALADYFEAHFGVAGLSEVR